MDFGPQKRYPSSPQTRTHLSSRFDDTHYFESFTTLAHIFSLLLYHNYLPLHMYHNERHFFFLLIFFFCSASCSCFDRLRLPLGALAGSRIIPSPVATICYVRLFWVGSSRRGLGTEYSVAGVASLGGNARHHNRISCLHFLWRWWLVAALQRMVVCIPFLKSDTGKIARQ